MRPSPILSAAAAAALLAAVAGPATAATEPVPARGVASSSVTLLGVAAGGHTVTAGTLELLSDMLGAQSVAKILLTPVTADGTPYGQQVVTPASSPMSAPVVRSGDVAPALAGLAGLRSPVLQASATEVDGQPSTSAGADDLGGVTVLGLPLSLDGDLDVGSAVTRAGGSVGTQELLVEDVALPSIADLLGALGLDLEALPVEVLVELLTELDLVTTTVTQAQQALQEATAQVQTQIDAAQEQVDAATAALEAEVEELAGKQSELAAAEQDLQDATAALAPLRTALTSAQAQLVAAETAAGTAQSTYDTAFGAVEAAADLLGMSVSAYSSTFAGTALVGTLNAATTALSAANATVTSASTAVDEARADVASAQSLVDAAAAAVTLIESAIATLQAVIDGLQATLDAALELLDSILTTVQVELDALLGAITAVLDGTPLVSFDRLSILTRSTATSNQAGGQTAEIVGGELTGLEVLGTDVLTDVLQLDSGSLDLLDLVGSTLAELDAAIGGLTGTLSRVLSSVPEFPTLSVPAPRIGLLSKTTSTDVVDGFGVASTSVKGLSVTLPAVSIPSALALPGAADLPALAGVDQVAGLLTSAPVKVDLVTLSSGARFAPAVAGSPSTGTPPGTVTPPTTGTPTTGTPTTGTPTTGTPTTGTPTTGTPPTTATPRTVIPVAAPQLPRTGTSQALAALGAALMAAAVVTRRRRPEVLDDLAA